MQKSTNWRSHASEILVDLHLFSNGSRFSTNHIAKATFIITSFPTDDDDSDDSDSDSDDNDSNSNDNDSDNDDSDSDWDY